MQYIPFLYLCKMDTQISYAASREKIISIIKLLMHISAIASMHQVKARCWHLLRVHCITYDRSMTLFHYHLYVSCTLQYTDKMVIPAFHNCMHTLMYTIIGHVILQGMLLCVTILEMVSMYST